MDFYHLRATRTWPVRCLIRPVCWPRIGWTYSCPRRWTHLLNNLFIFFSEEEYRIHELSLEVSRLQDVMQKQREEMRMLERDATQKTAELEVVSSCCLFREQFIPLYYWPAYT